LSINWKFILQLWTIRNKEVKGDSLEKSRYIQRQEMIQELYIQNTHQHLPLDTRSLIDRDIKSLQGMNTSTLTAYLYGAQMVAQSAKTQQEDTTQRNIRAFFQRQERVETTENNTQGQHQLQETT
jgi:alpha-D-ribose 1-methylphosphonate 5-phosphate C-P lyase